MKKNILTVTKKAVFAAVLAAAVSTAVPSVPAHAAAKLNKKSVTLNVKQTVTLKLKGNTKKVKWTSTKPAVASVTQKGKVTAKKAGRANIKAKAGKKTYTCKVTVKAAAVKDDTVKADESLGTDAAASADENTSAADNSASTGSASGSTEAQAPVTVQPAHEHDYVPHYSYDGTGKAVKNAYFCTDTTCADNQGYGTDNGWRGGTYTPWYDSRDNAVSAQPSQGTTVVTNPADNNTADVPSNSNTADDSSSTQTGNTADNSQTGSNTGDAQTGQTEEKPAGTEHSHDYTVPVMSADSLRVEGYACECGERASHSHEWTEAVKNTEGFLAGTVKGYRCACGETISAEGYAKLAEANRKASETIKNAWTARNITAGMTDIAKVKAIAAEMNSWAYGAGQSYETSNISRKADCSSANKAFAEYCAAAGIRAEAFDASQMLGVSQHWMSYVWVDGKQCVVDATPYGHGLFTGTVLTAEGFDLYLDWTAGIVTDEQYDAEMPQHEL